jgi:hypothetical protein
MKGTRNAVHSLYLKVTMTDKKTVYLLRDLFNLGTVQLQSHGKKAKKNWGLAYSWLCCSQDAATAIRKMLPYLVTKAAEAEVALEFAAIPRQRGSSRVVPREILLHRHRCYTQMCLLKPTNKRRGIVPKKLAISLPGKSRYKQLPNAV